MPAGIRRSVVSRLTIIYAAGTLAMALAYITITVAVRYLANAFLASAHKGPAHPATPMPAFAILIPAELIELVLPLVVGFFGARFMLRAMRQAVPPHLAVPTAPIPWATLSAGAIILCFEVLTRAFGPDYTEAAWSSRLIVILIDLLVIGLLWYGARRSLTAPGGRALAAAFKPTGSSLTKNP